MLALAEDLRERGQGLFLPVIDLADMDLVPGGQLDGGLLAFDRGDGHLGLERFAVAFALHLENPSSRSLYLKGLSQIPNA